MSKDSKGRSEVSPWVARFEELPDTAFVSVKVLAAIFGKSPATIWRWSKPGGSLFAPTRTGPNSVGWNVGRLRQKIAEMQFELAPRRAGGVSDIATRRSVQRVDDAAMDLTR